MLSDAKHASRSWAHYHIHWHGSLHPSCTWIKRTVTPGPQLIASSTSELCLAMKFEGSTRRQGEEESTSRRARRPRRRSLERSSDHPLFIKEILFYIKQKSILFLPFHFSINETPVWDWYSRMPGLIAAHLHRSNSNVQPPNLCLTIGSAGEAGSFGHY